MPLPTATDFKARHARFATIAPETVDAYLAEAGRSVIEAKWAAGDYADGVMYFAAHRMIMEGAAKPTKASPGTGGQKKRVKADKLEVEYVVDRDPSIPAEWRGSDYGVMYWRLALRNSSFLGVGLMVVPNV